MAHTTKIATCCYCGARSILQLTARNGHELACGSCGAPLHEMKPLKQNVKQSRRDEVKRKKHHYPDDDDDRRRPEKRKSRRNPRKSTWKKAMEEIFDVIEDIID